MTLNPKGGAFYGAGASSMYREAPKDDFTGYLMNWISPRYFETAGTRLLAGRDFDEVIIKVRLRFVF